MKDKNIRISVETPSTNKTKSQHSQFHKLASQERGSAKRHPQSGSSGSARKNSSVKRGNSLQIDQMRLESNSSEKSINNISAHSSKQKRKLYKQRNKSTAYLGKHEEDGNRRSMYPVVSPMSGSSHRLSPGKGPHGRARKDLNPRRSIQISKLSKQESDKVLSPGAEGLPDEGQWNHVRSNKDLRLDKLVQDNSTSSEQELITQEKQENLDDEIQREFKQTETEIIAKRKSKIQQKLGNTVDQNAMSHLNLNFEKFDQDKHLQMYIDKASFAVVSEHSSHSSDEDIMGSIETTSNRGIMKDPMIMEMCRVLEQPQALRTQQQLQQIIPYFKKLGVFDKLMAKSKDQGQGELPETFFHKILQHCWIQKMKKGQYVMYEGDFGDQFFIILQGSVSVLVNNDQKTHELERIKKQHEDAQSHPSGSPPTGTKGTGTGTGPQQSTPGVQNTHAVNSASKRFSLLSVDKCDINQHHFKPPMIPSPHENKMQKNKSTINSTKLSARNALMGGATITSGGDNAPANLHSGEVCVLPQQQSFADPLVNSTSPSQKQEQTEEEQIHVLVMQEVARKHQGDIFGEMAINNCTGTRSANIKCIQNCIFLVISDKDYNLYLRRMIEKLGDDKIAFMRGTTLFANWSKSLTRSTINQLKVMKCTKGREIVTQNMPNPYLYIIAKGQFKVTIKIRKPYDGEAESNQKKAILQNEKYKLKDTIHGIVRHTNLSLEEQNCAIEGDDTGMMGAHKDWPQISKHAEQYIDRMEQKRLLHEENQLRQRLLTSNETKEKIKKMREYYVTEHEVATLMPGQCFGEECILIKDCLAKYSVTVTSETAEIWYINELEFQKKMRQMPETRNELKRIMCAKTKQVQEICKTWPSWSLINSEVYSQFYIDCFYKKPQIDNDILSGMEETAENKQVIKETKVFERQYISKGLRPDKTIEDVIADQGIDDGQDENNKAIKKILERNLDLLHQKVDDMDQINGIVDMHPLKRTFMPQMENKKRYHEVQSVVSPNISKGQKPFIMFKDESFIRSTLAEAQFFAQEAAGKPVKKLQRPKTSMVVRNLPKRAQRSLNSYESKLKKLQNIQGGGSLVNGRTFDFRKVMEEIVKEYPMVHQQKEVYLRDQALKRKDANGVPIHKTPQMLLNEKFVDDETEFEKLLYRTFDESPDPMQLINILRRKLSINDPEHGAKNVQILDEMLSREPLRKFVLFANKYYCSTEIFDQIAQIQKLKGNVDEVYKKDQEYQTMMKSKQNRSPPAKKSYFQQQLEQKHSQALFHETQMKNRLMQEQRQQQLEQISNFGNDRVSEQMSHMAGASFKGNTQLGVTAPKFESQELQQLFSRSGHTSRQNKQHVLNEKTTIPVAGIGIVPAEINPASNTQTLMNGEGEENLNKSQYDSQIVTPQVLESNLKEGKETGTERMTYNGDKESVSQEDEKNIARGDLQDEYGQNPLDVKFVKADIAVKHAPKQVQADRVAIVQEVLIQEPKRATPQQPPSNPISSALTQSLHHQRKQSQPHATAIKGNYQNQESSNQSQVPDRPVTSLLQQRKQNSFMMQQHYQTSDNRMRSGGHNTGFSIGSMQANNNAIVQGLYNQHIGSNQNSSRMAGKGRTTSGHAAIVANKSGVTEKELITSQSSLIQMQKMPLSFHMRMKQRPPSFINNQAALMRNQTRIANVYTTDSTNSAAQFSLSGSRSIQRKRTATNTNIVASEVMNLTAATTSQASLSRAGRVNSNLVQGHQKRQSRDIQMQVASLRRRQTSQMNN